MKKIGIATVAGLAMVFLTVPLVCLGGSGSAWHMTVKNTSAYSVRVNVYYAVGWMGEVPIAPGGEHRFDIPGARCPEGLVGFYSVNGRWLSLVETSCSGNDKPWTCACWAVCCANTTWEICQRSDGLGFCKR